MKKAKARMTAIPPILPPKIGPRDGVWT